MTRPQDVADGAVAAEVSPPQVLARGYRAYERFHVRLPGATVAQERDVLRGGRVVAVVPVDLARAEIVLIRQFRLAAHLGNGLGEMVEVPAGRLEPDESYAGAAARECAEETGVTPRHVVEVFSYFPTPGLTDERIVVCLAAVDAAVLPQRAGLDAEMEETRPFALALDDIAAALDAGGINNGATVMALQWLLLNRARLPHLLGAAS
jgi:ADP-ribose pyrophosphatase